MRKQLLTFLIFLSSLGLTAQEENPIYLFKGNKPLTHKTTFNELIIMIGFPDTLVNNANLNVKALPTYVLSYADEGITITMDRKYGNDKKKLLNSTVSYIEIDKYSEMKIGPIRISKMDTTNVQEVMGKCADKSFYEFFNEIFFDYELQWKNTKYYFTFRFNWDGKIEKIEIRLTES